MIGFVQQFLHREKNGGQTGQPRPLPFNPPQPIAQHYHIKHVEEKYHDIKEREKIGGWIKGIAENGSENRPY